MSIDDSAAHEGAALTDKSSIETRSACYHPFAEEIAEVAPYARRSKGMFE